MSRPDEELPLSAQKPVHEDVTREVADHLERRTAELIAAGWDANAARAEAQRAFGDVTRVAAECREITARDRRARRRTAWLDAFRHDMTFAVRLLRRAPGFATVAVLTLALGVGANTAIFSVINALLLRPLPYEQPQQLVDVIELHKHGSGDMAYANFLDMQAQSRSFDGLAKYGSDRATVLGADAPIRAVSAQVSRDFFRVMRVQPVLGRLPAADEYAVGASPTAVVSTRFWREHLGSTRDLSHASLRGEYNFQIVGVMPDGFGFPDDADLWYPLELSPQSMSRTAHNWSTIGRLKAGVTPAAATADINRVFDNVRTVAGADFDAVGGRVTPLQDLLTSSVRKPLMLLLGAAALVLLTACTNLASTLLARGAVRRQELAVRTAIGAGRGRIIRQIFTESLLIALLGCGVGIVLAAGLVRGLIALAPPSLALLRDAHLDGYVLGFALAVSLATAILFGLLPGFRVSDVNTAQLMRSSTRGSTGGPARGVWSALVIIEVALAVVLLIGSSLLLRSFAAVMNVDIGFQPAQVLTIDIDLPQQAYRTVEDAVAFHDRALAAIRALPGVQAAGVINVLPLDGQQPNGGIQVDGKPPLSPAYPTTGQAVYRITSTGYFDAMGIRIVRGRAIDDRDVAGGMEVAVVNEAFATNEWPGEDPIGKRFRIGGMDSSGMAPWTTVVGVAHNVPDVGVTAPAKPAYFYSYRQMSHRSRWLTAVVRTSASPEAMIAPIRNTLRQFAPDVPLEFRTMSNRVASAVADRRFTMLLLGLFGLVALLLAAVGIYGVISYSVAQRTREIGIRIALGAAPRSVGRMVQGEALRVVGLGVLVGGLGALAATRLLRSLLFDISPADPASFGLVAVLLLLTAAAASWLPARRGTRIDPVSAIRSE